MKGKLAWLCYDEPEDTVVSEIRFVKPEKWQYARIVPIVYFEVEE